MKALLIDRFPKGEVTARPHPALVAMASAMASFAYGPSTLKAVSSKSASALSLAVCEALGSQLSPVREAEISISPQSSKGKQKALTPKAAYPFLAPLKLCMGIPLEAEGSPEDIEGFVNLVSSRPVESYTSAGRTGLRGKLSAGKYIAPENLNGMAMAGLIAGLCLESGDSEIILAKRALYLRAFADMLGECMAAFGVYITIEGPRVFIPGRQSPFEASYEVPGSYASAAPFLASGALGREVRLFGLGDETQPEAAAVAVFEQLGARAVYKEGMLAFQPEGHETVDCDVSAFPAVAGPVLAAMLRGGGEGTLSGAASQDAPALAGAAQALGADVSLAAGKLSVRPARGGLGGTADAAGSAAAAYLAALCAIFSAKPVWLKEPGAAEDGCEGFWKDYLVES